MSLLLLLLACQEPFGSDRHTLEDFRIAGVRAVPTEDGFVAEALLVVDGRLWSSEPVDLAWAWLPDGEDPNDWTGHADRVGPSPTLDLPARERDLLLVAVAPDGTERRAVLPVSPALAPGPIGPISIAPSAVTAPGETLELSAPDAEPERMLRWMGTSGTWFEQTPTSAEWTPDDVVLDDGEEVSRKPGVEGVTTLVALHPGLDWVVLDVAVGPTPTDGALVDGRWLPAAAVGLQSATLALDPDASLGLQVTATEAATTAPTRPDRPVCDGDLLVPDWLASGACTPEDFTGRAVLFEGTEWP